MVQEKGIKELLNEIKIQVATKDQPEKQFKWPSKWRRQFKKSTRLENQLLLLYLNMKGEWETPKIVPVVSGDIIVHKLKAYRIDPRDITRLGKYRAYVCREIDSELIPVGRPKLEPISNSDYDEVVQAGRSTSNHPTLLKAILAARQDLTPKKKPINMKMMFWVLVALAIGGVILFTLTKKG